MSNLNIQNLLVIGPTGKKEYKAQVQELIESVLVESKIEVDSTDVYEILNSLGYTLENLSDPTIVDIVATKIAQIIIRRIKERKDKQDKAVDGKEGSYHQFCAAVDSNCAVSLSVKAKLQSEKLPELSFIDLPYGECKSRLI